MLQASVDNRGVDSAAVVAEAVTTFARGGSPGSAINWPATAAAVNGRRLKFKEQVLFDSTGLDPASVPYRS